MPRRPPPLEPVDPAEPVAPWIGGKRLLAKRIADRVEAIPHDCYAEPFSGLGGVFLRRSSRPKSEILNDINKDISNLFRVVREHPAELFRQFRWHVTSREEFARLVAVPPETCTDIQRAARFAFLQRLSFGGKPAHLATAGNFAPQPHHHSKVTEAGMERFISRCHARLQGVHVECLDWARFILRYDRPWTLFYIDPPYWGHEQDYGKGLFAREDFARMAEILRCLKGRFILSLNDRPEVRELFKSFVIEAVETTYTANAKATRRVGELLISGKGTSKVGQRTGVTKASTFL